MADCMLSSKEKVEALIRQVNARIPSSVTPATRIEIHPCEWLELVDEVRAAAEPPAGPNVAEEISAGIRHDYGDQTYTLPERDLVAMTVLLDEHPEWWDHPCLCAECRTHG